MHLRQEQLAVWNAENTWAVEPRWYTLWAGGSSEAD
jgi:beta-glucosidase